MQQLIASEVLVEGPAVDYRKRHGLPTESVEEISQHIIEARQSRPEEELDTSTGRFLHPWRQTDTRFVEKLALNSLIRCGRQF